MQQFSRYKALVSQLAGTSLHAAAQAMGALGAESAAEASLTVALPAAQRLLGDATVDFAPGLRTLAEIARGEGREGERVRLVTLTGQSRPVYYPLAVHLFLRAGLSEGRTPEAARQNDYRAAVEALALAEWPGEPREQFALELWRGLCEVEAAALLAEPKRLAAGTARVEQTLREAGDGGEGEHDAPLHPQDPADQLDAWTYRELVGLHALAALALHTGRADWQRRVERAARFHLEHTQPDYTTYEPWGVAGFLSSPMTVPFADQQLHDAVTNLRLSGDTAGLIPGLLLADAADALARLHPEVG